MSRFQALVIICLALCVPMLALVGQAKLGAFILATALMASVLTVFYGMSKNNKKEMHSIYD